MAKRRVRIDKKTKPDAKSYVSLFYGAITFFIVFIVVFFGAKIISQRIHNNPSILPEAAQTEVVMEDEEEIIEEDFEESLNNEEVIVESTKEPQEKVVQESVQNKQKITGNSYTVISGDNLWDIAVRAYGDGYRWVDIAEANNLANPDLIHRGNVFKLPR